MVFYASVDGVTAATQNFTLTVNPPVPSAITSAASTQFTVGQAGTFQVVASGLPAPTFSWAGILPEGVQLTPDGILQGTPTGSAGTYQFIISADNGSGTLARQSFTLSVINVNAAPTADAGGPYSVNAGQTVQLNGSGADVDAGDTLTYVWDLDNDGTFETAGQNPNFSAAGMAPGSRTVNLRVTDAAGLFADSSADVTINPEPVAPTILSVTPSIKTISDAQIGLGTFTITVVFDMSMNVNVAPTLSFPNEDAASTLLFANGSWKTTNRLNDTYEAHYNVADVDALFAGVDVRVSGGQDAANGLMPQAIEMPDLLRMDMQPPRVQSIKAIKYDRSKKVLTYQVRFTEAVIGLTVNDFELKTSGRMQANVQSVTGSGTTWFVKVKLLSTQGSLQLLLKDRNSISDLVGNLLGAKDKRDGDFSSSELREGMFPLVNVG